MGNTALTRAFFKCLSLLTKDEEITSKCIILYHRREKSCHLYILPGGENQHWAKIFVYWEWSCIQLVPQCGNFVCKRTAGIVLQRASQPTDPPAFPRRARCLAYSFWLWSLKRVHRGATGSDFPSHLLLQKKKRVWSQSSKNTSDWIGPQTNPYYTQNVLSQKTSRS